MATHSNYVYHLKGKGGGAHSSEFYKAAAERYYKETMENAASYNTSIRTERTFRLPFLDSQTGVAQNHSNLWNEKRYRSKGTFLGQIYTYPAKRWRKKKRPFPAFDIQIPKASTSSTVETGEADLHQISTLENPAAKVETQSEYPKLEQALTDSPQVAPAVKQYEYYDEWENGSDPPDAGEIDDRNSDSSDFEETYIKKRKKKATKCAKQMLSATKARVPLQKGPGRGRRSNTKDDKVVDEVEKPYSCELCGARYKTRPGLSYHLSHFHHKMEEDEEETVAPAAQPSNRSPSNGKSGGKTNGNNPNNYCDFCLGDEDNNKKTGGKEELVSCADCGRSGHPTCLQFTENMIISVKKYPWQCIECKSCGLCGTSDNDDQLLFCDDCDRGYHMYCLNPPLSAPPEGSWSCHLCIVEFYGGKPPHTQDQGSSQGSKGHQKAGDQEQEDS